MSKELRKLFCKTHPRPLKTTKERQVTQKVFFTIHQKTQFNQGNGCINAKILQQNAVLYMCSQFPCKYGCYSFIGIRDQWVLQLFLNSYANPGQPLLVKRL